MSVELSDDEARLVLVALDAGAVAVPSENHSYPTWRSHPVVVLRERIAAELDPDRLVRLQGRCAQEVESRLVRG